MNFLFFKKSKPENKPAEQSIEIAVPNQTRLTYKPRPTTPPSAPVSTVSPFLPKSLGAVAPAEAPVADFDNTSSPNDARVTLDSVLECVPAEMLKPDLGGVSRSVRVNIPANVIIPQLPTGKVSIPLRELLLRLPQDIFIAQRPGFVDRIVNLPLHKIVPQLPADFFQPDARQQSLSIEDSFVPQPFGEDPSLQPAAQSATEQTSAAVAAEEPSCVAPIAEIAKPSIEQIPAPQASVFRSVIARVAIEDNQPKTEKTPDLETPKPMTPPVPVIEPEPAMASAESNFGYDQDMLDRAMEDAEAEELFATCTEAEEIKPIATFESPKPVSVVAEQVTPVEPAQPLSKSPMGADAPKPQSTVATPAQHETTAAPTGATATPVVEETREANVDTERPLNAMELNQCLININSCTAEDLTRIPGVGPALAQKIIEFRNARGTITDVNQLRQIPGVGNKTFRRIVGAGPSPRGKVVRLVNHLLGAPQDRELTLQEIVRLTAQQPGVAGCIMATDDGMFVTGQLPASLDAQTISAFAPQLFRRVSRYVKELKVGQVRRFSLFTDEQPVSIFYAGKIYLVVIHAPNRFSKTLLNRCERLAKEINRMCTNHVTV